MSEPASHWKVSVPVGALAGAASALLFLAGLRGQPSGTLFLLVSPMPLFLAGLGWGLAALLIGVAGGLGLLVGIGGAGAAIVFGGFAAAAPILVVALMTFGAHAERAPGPAAAATTIDPGRVLVALALLGAVMILTALAAAESAGGFGTLVDQFLGTTNTDIALVQRELVAKGIHMDRTQMAALVTHALPPAFTAGWLILSVCNAVLAEEILVRSGRALRPSPPYRTLTVPRLLVVALGLSIGLCFAPGWLANLGFAFSALLAVIYFFLGLAVIHAISRRLPARTFTLAAIYLCVVLFAWPVLILALLGLVDQWADLRGRAMHHEREIK